MNLMVPLDLRSLFAIMSLLWIVGTTAEPIRQGLNLHLKRTTDLGNLEKHVHLKRTQQDIK